MTPPSPWGPLRWATNGPVRLAFDEWTEPTEQTTPTNPAEPLLLATGLGANRFWVPDGLCRLLAAHGFTVVRYDQRDGGQSTHLPPTEARNPIAALFAKRQTAYTAEDMADDAIAVLDELGWESAHLVGVSLGGAIVQRVALRHPERVRTLTTMASVPGDVAGLKALPYIRLGTLAKFARLKFPDTPEGTIAAGVEVTRLLASPQRPFDPAVTRRAVEANPDAGVYDGEAQSRQIGAQWHGPPISGITRPLLVLHGEDDPLIKPRAAKAIASRVPGARMVPLPRVGHEVPEPSWERIVAEIRQLATRQAA
ncbi:alpha/beta hydrolase [Streptomyces spiroverticillatus]|uniref:Alpha/beta hydrolase n=1 Tax=Streptomyces finlayi TaxID=67296 RepID=A0A919C9N1_9ACTN|nr:alpha/beta hydrolase [Streptomyces finlayi]GHA06752.1 alpha/beta hydrolase [Streptomyces spiroverticillatus]GHC90228.1 alpha/beta hydrolase [Streptomyces finlayi]